MAQPQEDEDMDDDGTADDFITIFKQWLVFHVSKCPNCRWKPKFYDPASPSDHWIDSRFDFDFVKILSIFAQNPVERLVLKTDSPNLDRLYLHQPDFFYWCVSPNHWNKHVRVYD